MKVRVLKPCKDGKTGKQLNVGDVIEFTAERLRKAPVGFVEVVPESATTKRRGRPKKKVE